MHIWQGLLAYGSYEAALGTVVKHLKFVFMEWKLTRGTYDV